MRETMKRKTNQGITFKEAYEAFIRVRRNMKVSEETLRFYEDNYKNFTTFFDEDKKCADITEDTIQRYIEHLRDRNSNLKDISINTYLRAIRTVLRYCMERKYMEDFKIKLLKVEEEIKEVYEEDELARLLKKPDLKKCNFAELRNWAMTNYMLATGNRVKTITGIKIKDLDFENHVVYLRELKNKRPYLMPLSLALEKILIEYLDYKTNNKPEDYLFPSTNGSKLTKDGFKTAIQRYNHKRGVLKTSSHLYRHLFSKTYLSNGGDISRLQGLLGHSTPVMSLKYAKMYGDDLKAHFNERNPLDIYMKNKVFNKEKINRK